MLVRLCVGQLRLFAALPVISAALSACAHGSRPPMSASAEPAQAGGAPASAATSARPRPAMVACPWPNAAADSVSLDLAPAAPTGVSDPPRPRIPNCAPPGWKRPDTLRRFVPPTIPSDRPRPIVDDYLSYVVTAPPPELVERFKLDTTFYRKYADANGYPILGSGKVSDAAVAIARDLVNYLLAHRPDVRDSMLAHGGRVVVMAETEYTMDVPEQGRWIVPRYLDPRLTPQERARYYQPGGMGSMSPEAYWNARARGMGGTLTTCAEENVLGRYRTRYWGTNICVHEFSHAIMGAGIGNADPKWFRDIVAAYNSAKARCLRTASGYAGNTFNEYWATGVEWYIGNGGRERAALRAADSTLYELVSRLMPESKFVPQRANVANRTRDEMERYVRERNPDWWAREQERVAAQRDTNQRPGATPPAAAAAPPCVPRQTTLPERQSNEYGFDELTPWKARRGTARIALQEELQ